jgi:hypothetical protein
MTVSGAFCETTNMHHKSAAFITLVIPFVELNPNDQSAIGIVARIDELFGIDARARDQRLSQQDCQILRLEKSKPLLEQIKTQIHSARCDALPKSVGVGPILRTGLSARN